MFKSIRLRIALSYLLLVVAVMLVTGFILLNMLENYHMSSEEERLERTGRLAAEFMAPFMREEVDPVLLSSVAESFSSQFNARVLVVDSRQMVLGDSVRVGGLLGTGLDRQEVKTALEGDVGQSVQYSQQSEQWVLQIAVPILEEENDQVLGAAFISSSLTPVYETITALQRFLIISTLVAMAFSAGLAIVISHHLTVPIKELTDAARQMAEGKLDQKIDTRSRDEIGQLARQFNLMASKVKEMNQRLTRFVADVSHELRTPLASMLIGIQSLQNYEMEPEEQQEFLKDINQQTQRMIYLVEDLLELTRRQEVEEARETVPLRLLLEEVLETTEPRVNRKGLSLFREMEENLPYIQTSPEAIKRVLFNLLDNAIKFTPAGGWLKVSTQTDPGQVTIIVEDTGCGVPEESLPHVFDRFYRVDKARSREMGGTGLGLSICKEIVELYGGDISVTSQEGEGSSFKVTLPVSPLLHPGQHPEDVSAENVIEN